MARRKNWLYPGGLLTALFAAMLMAVPALGHAAKLHRAEPADRAILALPPQEVALWFEEELLSETSNIKVYDAAGQRDDAGGGGLDLDDPDHLSLRVALPSLADGVYTVDWTAKLVDGDISTGQLQFAVGADLTAAVWADGVTAETEAAASISPLLVGGGVLVLGLLAASGYVLWRRAATSS